MISFMFVLSMMLSSAPDPAYVSGDVGLYTQAARFRKPGQVFLNVSESFGNKNDPEGSRSSLHNQLCANLQYAPFSRMVLGIGGTSYTLQDESFRGAYANMKLPLLSLGPLSSSIGPSAVFSKGNGPLFGAMVLFDLIPFSAERLPPFLLSHSFAMHRNADLTEYWMSSVLTFHKGRFLPFLELYTEFHDHIDWESAFNTRIGTGLALLKEPFLLRAGVETPLNEYEKRDFDFRFSAEIAMLFNTTRRTKVTVTISVFDAESDEKIDATITVRGKGFEMAVTCTEGECSISDLVAGIYTVEIQHSGYKTIKAPLFIKDKSMERTYKLTKITDEKGGD